MARLYPPNIEGTIPAFYSEQVTKANGSTEIEAVLTVPFAMNRAVNKSEVREFAMVLKTVQNNNHIIQLNSTDFDIEDCYEVKFTFDEDKIKKLHLGQFYKVQIAYIAYTGEVGYYSTVGVVKYTTKPIVTIDPLVQNNINMHRYNYIGHYAQLSYEYNVVSLNNLEYLYKPNKYYILVNNNYDLCSDTSYDSNQTYYERKAILSPDDVNYKDTSEKEYSYRFILTNSKGAIVADSGTLLHNSSKDLNSYESYDTYDFPSDLEENISYYIQYIVTTTNNMVVESPKYRIMQKTSIAPEIEAELVAELNRDNGYVDVKLVGKLNSEYQEFAATGAFLITRACEDDGYKVWNEVLRFVLHGQQPSRWLWRDYTIEQGKNYKYSLQQYNDAGLYSARIISNIVEADFEDIFLYDGKRQLKIKYNPKVSSFKTDILESKTDTIGSKHPFIFRNASVSYKEFPINGLISYQSDEENLFVNDADLGLDEGYDKLVRTNTLREGVTSSDDAFFLEMAGIITPEQTEAIQYIMDYLKKNPDKTLANLKEDYLQKVEDIKYFTFPDEYIQIIQDLEQTGQLDPSKYSASYGELKTAYAIKDILGYHIDANRKRTTDLVAYNIAAERRFKLDVLDWLNNGEPKLFRSPAEGNYIVRLMNVNLTPEDQLGRMLHSFSATAYEIAHCTYENLNNYGIITIDMPNNSQMRWETLLLSTTEEKHNVEKGFDERYIKMNDVFYLRGEILHGYHAMATSVRFTDMMPGSIVYINVPIELQNSTDMKELQPFSYVIGATGTYMLEPAEGITSIMLPMDAKYNGAITISYYNDAQNVFNAVENIIINETPCQQYIGAQNNIIAQIEDVKTNFMTFYYLHFALRYCDTAFWNPEDDILYRYSNFTNPITDAPIDERRDLDDGIIGSLNEYIDPLMLYSYSRDFITADDGSKIYGLKPYDEIKLSPAMKYYDPKEKDYYRLTADKQFIKCKKWFEPVIETNYKLGKQYYYWSGLTKSYEPVPDAIIHAQGKIEEPYNTVDKDGVKGPFTCENDNITPQTFLHYFYLEDYLETLFSRGMFYKENGIEPTEYDPTVTQYYVIDPFTACYDHYNPTVLIMEQDDIDRFKQTLKANNKTYSRIIKPYGTSIYIDGHRLDLKEIESYNIDRPVRFSTVTQDCGVVLECAYETQQLEYNIEREGIVSTLKQKYLTYKGVLTTGQRQKYYEDNNEEEYVAKMEEARKNIGDAYSEFIEALNAEKARLEAGEN